MPEPYCTGSEIICSPVAQVMGSVIHRFVGKYQEHQIADLEEHFPHITFIYDKFGRLTLEHHSIHELEVCSLACLWYKRGNNAKKS